MSAYQLFEGLLVQYGLAEARVKFLDAFNDAVPYLSMGLSAVVRDV